MILDWCSLAIAFACGITALTIVASASIGIWSRRRLASSGWRAKWKIAAPLQCP